MNTPPDNYTPLPPIARAPRGWIWTEGMDGKLVPVAPRPREAWLIAGGDVLDRERRISEATKGKA